MNKKPQSRFTYDSIPSSLDYSHIHIMADLTQKVERFNAQMDIGQIPDGHISIDERLLYSKHHYELLKFKTSLLKIVETNQN